MDSDFAEVAESVWWFGAAVLLIAIIAVALSSCAAKHFRSGSPPPPFSVVVPRHCIKAIDAGPDTYCRGTDLQHLHCYRIRMTIRSAGCEQLDITATEEHKPQ